MKNEEFKPYVPADKITPEFTVTSIIMGVLLAVIFGAANAYLGLRVGMTVSASIPAAVISMAVIRVILRKDSILESNMVQTIGSAGESLAAGAIFTLPALFIWAKEGVIESKPGVLMIFIIALCGGLLGVFFMVPLRNALIVKEHGVLPYPEGTACAEVLLAGEEGGSSAKSVFAGMGIAAALKFIVDGLKVAGGSISIPLKALKTEFSTQVYPALLGVGYICGPRIASFMFAGGVLAWFVLIPAIVLFGGDIILFPGNAPISELYSAGGAAVIWKTYIKYIGAGAVAAGGIISLCKLLPLIIKTFVGAMKSMKGTNKEGELRTEKSLDMRIILIGIAVIAVILAVVPQVPVNILGAVLIVVFGFFFATVSSRMVGIVGSSNNPVSGMAIATLIFATILLKLTGNVGSNGMQGAIAIGSIICIVAAMAGDTSQDLKTGYLLGATPRKQQIGEIIGAFVAAATIGGVMYLLDRAWGFGTEQIPAVQGELMKMIVEGVMDGNLPWGLIFIGAFIAVAVEIMGLSALPVAIGLYLPIELSSAIMIGGLVRLVTDRIKEKKGLKDKNSDAGSGVLFCSGMIAGEGLIGVLLALFAVIGMDGKIDLSRFLSGSALNIVSIAGAVLVLVLLIAVIGYFAMSNGKKKDK
ncbi:MAG: oligopeptide transporter, OPT family [Lachnospiraceae bacterium]|nr:oligopeptide transporter, OPT family [Lachnospiraceae bacterium]